MSYNMTFLSGKALLTFSLSPAKYTWYANINTKPLVHAISYLYKRPKYAVSTAKYPLTCYFSL